MLCNCGYRYHDDLNNCPECEMPNYFKENQKHYAPIDEKWSHEKCKKEIGISLTKMKQRNEDYKISLKNNI